MLKISQGHVTANVIDMFATVIEDGVKARVRRDHILRSDYVFCCAGDLQSGIDGDTFLAISRKKIVRRRL
jgi:hypothetical protein